MDNRRRPRILFVCGRNQWRSPTAEAMYRRDERVEVRSAGASDQSRRRVTEGDLAWADLVLVMEPKHKSRIVAAFRHTEGIPRIECLDIPDDYRFMDPNLVELLESVVEPHIADLLEDDAEA